MFEKEAEEYAIENWEHYEEGQNDSKALKQAYLAGAEFGYNKVNEQLTLPKDILGLWEQTVCEIKEQGYFINDK